MHNLLTIEISTHNFKVTKFTPRAKVVVNNFAAKYIQLGLVRKPGGRYVNEGLKVFAAATKDRTEYRFHINQLPPFLDFLKFNHISENLYKVINLPVPEGLKVTLPIRPNWKARESQLDAIAYMEEDNGNRSKFLDAQTGSGKGLMAMMALSTFGKRTVIIIKPGFIDKWVAELLEIYDIKVKDIMVVKGSGHLISLLNLAANNDLTAKVIIISNRTIQNWLKLYEEYGTSTKNLGYETIPENMFQDLKAGMRLIDELHMEFHNNFKIDLYTNVERSISLSATLISTDGFITSMHELMQPTKLRHVQGKLNRYINSHVVYYQLKNPEKIKTTEVFGGSYAHTAFEKSICKDHHTLTNYLNLINYTIQISFLKHTRVKKKLLVFASTIDMCTLLVKHFKKIYPQYDIRRYVGDDDFSDLIDSDICFSTLGSSGTAVDCPNLTTVILTVAIDSIQSNVQALGRLRVLDNNDKVEFYFFACLDVPKHMEYAGRKREMLERRAATYNEVYSRHVI